jgi:nicotinate phosphoribosyltransferase
MMAQRSILFTDFYQLTMAQLFFRQGMHETPSRFEYWYRRNPDYGTHQAGYGIFAGLDPLLDWMATTTATSADIEYLAGLRDDADSRIFSSDFLEWFAGAGNFSEMTVHAIAEGRVVHPNVPLVVIEGPMAMAQLLETPLLNELNHQTLIATKASRVVGAARGGRVVDFGLRRAPGLGANAATRAALIGGAVSSSNVEASRSLGTRPTGTHGHSMIQAFIAKGGSEIDAFRAYAETYPDGCVLLVDTIDTLRSGVPNAIEVFKELRGQGHEPRGIRLDSGDLAYLAVASARLLNDAGFEDVTIVLSSSLDELAIFQIISQIETDARRADLEPESIIGRLAFGVGSRLIASQGQSYLDGVYKLVALESGDTWEPAMKLSDTPEKAANPGVKSINRLYDSRGVATADVLSAEGEDLAATGTIHLHHPTQLGIAREVDADRISRIEPLHETVMENGKRLSPPATIAEMTARRTADLDLLDGGVRRLINPHVYHVSLSQRLWELKADMVSKVQAEL